MPTLYGFAYSEAALEYLETVVPKKVRRQIIGRIKALANDPHPSGSKPLQGVTDRDTPVYRLRQGKYRILYSINDGPIVTILDIDLRKDVYRRKG